MTATSSSADTPAGTFPPERNPRSPNGSASPADRRAGGGDRRPRPRRLPRGRGRDRQDAGAGRALLRSGRARRRRDRGDPRLHIHRARGRGDAAAGPRRAEPPRPPRARERLERPRARPGPARRLRVTTIHGFCRRLLATHPVAAGLDPRFRVLDEDEADGSTPGSRGGPAEARAPTTPSRRSRPLPQPARFDHPRRPFERLRNHGIHEPELPELAISAIRRPATSSPAEIAAVGDGYEALRELVAAFATRYDELKTDRSGLDFDRPAARASTYCASARDDREAWRARFDHLLVDEFQDTSPIQVELVECSRARDTPRSPSATTPSRSTDSATPTWRLPPRRDELAADAGPRPTAMLRLTGSFRSPRGARVPSTRSARRCCADFDPLGVGHAIRPPAARTARLSSCCSPSKPGWGDEEAGTSSSRASPRSLREPGDAGRRGSRAGGAAARARRRGGAIQARWSCCCAPSPTSTPTPRRSRWPASTPTSSAAAATGPSSRSRTPSPARRARQPARRRRCCSAPWPRPAAISPGRALDAAAIAGHGGAGAARSRRTRASARGASAARGAASRWRRLDLDPAEDAERLTRFHSTLAELRAAPRSGPRRPGRARDDRVRLRPRALLTDDGRAANGERPQAGPARR